MKLGNLMKQAQQMQAKVAKAQEELAAAEVEGQAGGPANKVDVGPSKSDDDDCDECGAFGIYLKAPSDFRLAV